MRADYGIDAPYVLVGLTATAAATGLAWLVAFVVLAVPLPALATAALIFALAASSYRYTTRRGQFIVWAGLLDGLALRGDERLLDVGCGRGAVLLLAAKRLPRGQAVGIDLWSRKDQIGESSRGDSAQREAGRRRRAR